MEQKSDDLGGRSKRENPTFTGLHKQTEADYESWKDCEKMVKGLIHDHLKITEDIQFNRVQRLRNHAKSPVIFRFTYFKYKQRVLKGKRKLSETAEESSIFIGEKVYLLDRTRGVGGHLIVPFLKTPTRIRTQREW